MINLHVEVLEETLDIMQEIFLQNSKQIVAKVRRQGLAQTSDS